MFKTKSNPNKSITKLGNKNNKTKRKLITSAVPIFIIVVTKMAAK